ncbi:MAG: DUF6443 domain-containing protein [bacterium]|nr:DUF6443 domain-containing protein [bacterium]
MKKISYLMIFLLQAISIIVLGQNNITEYTYLKPGLSSNTSSVNPDNVETMIHYLDGLGRSTQDVLVKGSPDKSKSVISPIKYGPTGEILREYLPYAVNSTSNFQLNYEQSQANYYNATGGTVVDTDVPFKEVSHESSPLGRTIANGFPGTWKLGSDKEVEQNYAVSKNESIKRFYYDQSSGLPQQNGVYPNNKLYKNIKTDENGNDVIEYRNSSDQVLLKRTTSGSGWMDTYYVYDDLGLLRFVLPPKCIDYINTASATGATDFLTSNTTLTSYQNKNYVLVQGATLTLKPGFSFTATSSKTFSVSQQESESGKFLTYREKINALAFQYKYDADGRMISKKVPGSGWVNYVYDERNRLVLSQDAEQKKANKWLFTKYDALNRPVLTGEYSYSGSQSQAQTVVNNYYNSLNSSKDWYEQEGSGPHGYTNKSFPQVSSSNAYLSVNYYDDYSFSFASGNYAFAQPSGFSTTPITYAGGQLTGTKIKVLGTTTWLKRVNYFDYKYRIIQSVGDNHVGGLEKVTTAYNFNGQVTKTFRRHTGHQTLEYRERFIYDHASRLIKHFHKVNNQTEILISELAYNEIGELIKKDYHSEDNGGSHIQSIDYRYNERGWLESINNVDMIDVAISTDNNDVFGEKIDYEANSIGVSGFEAQYNGNISAQAWKSRGKSKRSYNYKYDKANRLTSAKYAQISGSSWSGNVGMFNVSGLSYDKNGNIKTLSRWGNDNGKKKIDQLTYNYQIYHPNRLYSITDATNHHLGLKDDNKGSADYSYDSNGNLTKDLNKRISSIKYNHLNLPTEVKLSSGDFIKFTYDAGGKQLSKEVKIGSITTTTDYVSGIHYKDDTFKFLKHHEGRVVKLGSSYSYEYFMKDHIGNTRLVISENMVVSQGISYPEIIQRDDYYPFGLTYDSYSIGGDKVKYLYNGKELHNELGLNWYHYGQRYYDPEIGRWHSGDPSAMKMPTISPYAFAFNNPVLYEDKDGEIPIIPLLVKAGANGAADLMLQVAMNYYFDDKVSSIDEAFDNVDWIQVGRSSLEGLIPWKVPGGRLGKAAATAVVDVSINAFKAGSNYSAQQALQDFAIGFVGDLAGGGIGDLVAKYGAKGVARGITKIFGSSDDDLRQGIRYLWNDYVSSTHRGEVFEYMLAGTRFKNFRHMGPDDKWFPTIDFYKDGKGVSLKTTSATSGFGNIKKNIKDLAKARDRGSIRGMEINEVELQIGVPEGYDQSQLQKVLDMAEEYDIDVVIFEI